MENAAKISDGANVCYVTVNFNVPILEETDMPISNKRTNKDIVSTAKKQKNDEHFSVIFSADNTTVPPFLRKTGMDQLFLDHQKNSNYFQMTKKTKGRVIIISNRFSGTERERKGTIIDEKSLREAFESLQGKNAEVEITSVLNLSAREIEDYLKLFANSKNIPSFYAIVIMSHGGGRKRQDGGLDDMIEGIDNTRVSVKTVIEIFKKENLKDVPILMFFQMCRGKRIGASILRDVEAVESVDLDKDNEVDVNAETEDYENDDGMESAIEASQRTLLKMVLPGARFIGSEYEDGNDHIDAAGIPPSENDAGACSTSGNDEIDDSARIHVDRTKNMLVSFSTTEGHVSVRNEATGSWYIQALCDEMRENANNKDLVSMMNKVHQVVHARKSNEYVIACDTAHTFVNKQLFFFPRLPE